MTLISVKSLGTVFSITNFSNTTLLSYFLVALLLVLTVIIFNISHNIESQIESCVVVVDIHKVI